jgi:cytidylate kinase
MSWSNASDHVVEALIRAGQHEETRHPLDQSAKPHGQEVTIALTRETGAHGRTVARAVGQELGWPVYDHELLEQIAREMKMRVDVLERVDERRRSWLLDSLEALGSGPALSESGYVHHLKQVLFSLAKKGECVIVGRGAALLLPVATTLRVRMIADRDDRIEVKRKSRGLSREAAARHVDRTDAERIRFNKEHFFKNPADPSNYDLILSTSRFTLTECSALIINALRCLQARHGEAKAHVPAAAQSSPLGPKESQYAI